MSSLNPVRFVVPLVILALVAGCGPNVTQLAEQGDVPGLIAVLASDAEPPIRVEAASALGDLGDPAAVDPLIAALGDGDASVRVSAATALAAFPVAEVVESLLAALEDEDVTVRAASATSLGRIGQSSELTGSTLLVSIVIPLLDALDDEDGDVRDAAEESSSKIVAVIEQRPALRRAFVIELSEAIGEASPTVRAAAATILGGLEHTAALVPLLTALGDEDGDVRDAAQAAIAALTGSLDPHEATDELVTALFDEQAGVRAASAGTIAELVRSAAEADAGAIGRDVLRHLLAMVGDTDEAARTAAAAATDVVIGRMSARDAVELLMTQLDARDPQVAAVADTRLREMLAGMEPGSAVDTVVRAGAGDEWLAMALGVDPTELATATRTLGIQLDPMDDIVAAAAAVGTGSPGPGAHPYAASDTFHPAVVVGASAWDWNPAWAPTALRYLELVVVVDEISYEAIEVCEYVNHATGEVPAPTTRYRAAQTVRVLTATDASLVDERVVEGTNPRLCAETESYSDWEVEEGKSIYGEDPEIASLAEWLVSLIHPPTD